jgi:hypothetical protein
LPARAGAPAPAAPPPMAAPLPVTLSGGAASPRPPSARTLSRGRSGSGLAPPPPPRPSKWSARRFTLGIPIPPSPGRAQGLHVARRSALGRLHSAALLPATPRSAGAALAPTQSQQVSRHRRPEPLSRAPLFLRRGSLYTVEQPRESGALAYDVFGDTGTICRELEWKTPIFF